uniref:Uncharacterized protein n=1 Tax=Fagus sylvatica TaxID=28930 RepID=A0A2N9E768_FAGSY
MAKKKLTHQANGTKEEAPLDKNQNNTHQAKPMEDSTEKVQSLKSLNSLLLKETFERRQQVESLEQAKETLEAELTRSVMDKKVLEAELTKVSDESVGLELEKIVVCAFWETQMGEVGVGFDVLVREKVEVEKMKCEREAEIGFLKKEVNELKANLGNERDRFTRVCRERDLLKTEIDGLVEETKGLRGKVVEMEKKERKIEKEAEKLKVKCEGLKGEKVEIEKAVEAVKREKELVEKKLDESTRLIDGLKREIDGVEREKGVVERDRSVKEVKIGELEKEVEELNEFITKMQREEDVLRAKVLELEKRIDEAMDKEKEMVMEIKLLVEEKREKEQSIENLKEQRDSVQRVLDSTSKAAKLRDAIATVKESCRNEEEKNKKLVSELDQYIDAFDRVMCERDQVQKGFDEEKKKVMNMERALSMVKNTAALVTNSRDDSDVKERVVFNEQKLGEEIQPYEVELDAIKNAFRNNEKMVDDMKKQVVFLQSSVAAAHKRKSFWTVISSATTIFAAASVAYVARGR